MLAAPSLWWLSHELGENLKVLQSAQTTSASVLMNLTS